MVAARMKEQYARAAKERQQASGGDRKSDESVPVKVPEPNGGDARDKAGEAVGVSGKSVDQASRVLDKGTPELAKAVDDGEIPVSTAAKPVTSSGK